MRGWITLLLGVLWLGLIIGAIVTKANEAPCSPQPQPQPAVARLYV